MGQTQPEEAQRGCSLSSRRSSVGPGPAHACLAGFFPLRSWLAGVALSKQEVGAV